MVRREAIELSGTRMVPTHTHFKFQGDKRKMPQIFCSRVVILERLWKDIDFLWDGLVARFCRQSRRRKEGN